MILSSATMNRLNRLNRAELTALLDRAFHLSPNTIHLASALAKLNDDDASKYPARARYWRP